MKKIFSLCILTVLLGAAWMIHGCGSDSTSSTKAVSMPLVTPPVKASIPTTLGGGGTKALSKNMLISTDDFKSRFFTTGPTSIFSLLGTMDDLITQTNDLSKNSTSACLTQTPVAYTITPYGETVPMYGQCYVKNTPTTANDPAFFQFGIKDGVNYIYAASGQERVALIVTPVTGVTGQYSVQAWIGLGYSNSPWDNGSYGVMQLTANSSTKAFELSVAGIGFGYCGVQLMSDGTDISATGSSDMGTTCNAIDTLCVEASDGTTTGDCSSLTFTLPALGREAVTQGTNGAGNNSGVSQYPASPNILLTGAESDGDALYFGPETPTTGVNVLSSTSTGDKTTK